MTPEQIKSKRTERLNQIKLRDPKYAGLFERVYFEKPSRPSALKAKCLDCCGWQIAEIIACESVLCPLWDHRPYVKRPKNFCNRRNTQDKKVLAARMASWRARKAAAQNNT